MRAALFAPLLLSAATAALAQEETPPPTAFPGEPVVARALDSEALQRLGVVSPATETGRVPNLVSTISPGGNASRLFLRGLGSVDPLDAPAVVTIVDGVPLPTGIANNFILFDPQTVSVASGPFGTSSGPQALAGVVAIRNAMPGDRVGGHVEAGWGSEQRWLLRGSVDLPFADMLGFKISAYWQGDHGFAHNQTTGERSNDGDSAGIRAAVRLRPVDNLDWHVAVAYTENNGENLLNFACGDAGVEGCGRYLTTGMLTGRRLGGAPQYGVPVSGEKADYPLGSEVKTMLVSSRLEWTGERLTLLAVTGYVDTNVRQALDYGDGRPVPGPSAVRGFADGGYTVLLDGGYRQFSQELRATARFGALTLTGGGWFADRKDSSDAADMETPDSGVPVLLADRITRTETRELAGFAEARYAAGPFEAAAGLRYTDLQQTLAAQQTSEGIWAPRAEVAFLPAEGVRLFARAARAYRPGGYNIRATGSADLLPFATTIGWTYEAGATATLLDNRLNLSATGFYLDMDGVRTTDFLGLPEPAAGLKNHGIELELTAKPIKNLGLWGNFGWQSASYKDNNPLEPIYTPNVTASAGAFYDLPVAYAGAILTPMVELRYRGAMATDSVTRVDSSLLLNASLAVRTDDDNWTLALECRNCLNAADADSSLFGWTYLTTPRTWMLRARRNF